MKLRLMVCVVGVIFALLVQDSIASDGAIPIWEATTITESGSYVVTRDILNVPGHVLVVTADHVTIDLAGHIISTTFGGSEDCVRYSGSGNLVVKNGKLKCNEHGIYSSGGGLSSTIRVENVAIEGVYRGLYVNGGGHVDLLSCSVTGNSNIAVDVTAYTGSFVNNNIESVTNGFVLNISKGASVRDNNIVTSFSSGIEAAGSHVTIEGNTINSYWVGIYLTAESNLVANNIVRYSSDGGGGGIVAVSNHNRISGNVVQGGSSQPAIRVSGSYNLIEGNNLGPCSYGIYFESGSIENAYRDNMIREAGTTPIGDVGTDNFDASGNII